ncbi:MAG: hypothetical protein LBT59_24930 [Clostridiales bacterium]|jgi:hypothetical protein|nr:hypothetical protein [Clostridiales bacterium]
MDKVIRIGRVVLLFFAMSIIISFLTGKGDTVFTLPNIIGLLVTGLICGVAIYIFGKEKK